MLPSGRTPAGQFASLLSISLRSVPAGSHQGLSVARYFVFSFRFMVSVCERHPRLSGLRLAPRKWVFGLAATGPPKGDYRIGRAGVRLFFAWQPRICLPLTSLLRSLRSLALPFRSLRFLLSHGTELRTGRKPASLLLPSG